MMKLFKNTRGRDAYWLAGTFDARPNPFVDPALATWSEILGREQARLWLNARASEGRGR
jgi:hypothetical protein